MATIDEIHLLSMRMEELLAEYKALEQQKKDVVYQMDTDPDINKQSKKLKELDAERDALSHSITELKRKFDTTEIQDRQSEIKNILIAEWAVEGKTYKSDIATVTLRTTKSLIIDSVKGVVDVLVKNNKTEECIAKFKLEPLGKLAKAGLLDDATHYEEKKSVSIKLMEEK